MSIVSKFDELTDLSLADREALQVQVERILASGHFRNSRRCTDLLRYVVQQTLAGHAGILKERTIGIEVFGRNPSFDTSGDSIVRVAATDVRKRIAQYYEEPGHRDELRVELPPGSYVAHFSGPHEQTAKVATISESSEPVPQDQQSESAAKGAFWSRRRILAFSASTLAIIAVAVFVVPRFRPDPGLDAFWGPLIQPSTPLLICVGAVDTTDVSSSFLHAIPIQMATAVNDISEAPLPGADAGVWPAVSWSDAIELPRITDMLSKRNKKYQILSSKTVTLADLRNGPVIQLGVLENWWTLRFMSRLRFRPRIDLDNQRIWIEDSQHADRKDWYVLWSQAYSGSYNDYALVTRSRDPLSGQISVELGGLGLHATQAATEFVTSSANMNNLSRELRDPNKSVQVVLRVTVVKGEAGPPQVVAIYYW